MKAIRGFTPRQPKTKRNTDDDRHTELYACFVVKINKTRLLYLSYYTKFWKTSIDLSQTMTEKRYIFRRIFSV